MHRLAGEMHELGTPDPCIFKSWGQVYQGKTLPLPWKQDLRTSAFSRFPHPIPASPFKKGNTSGASPPHPLDAIASPFTDPPA